jgi:ABC-type molybdate transport system ATPase subunit
MSTTISPATATKIIGAVKSVMQWATNNGIIDVNPCAGITVAGAKQVAVEKARLPYDKADLKILFGPEALSKRKTDAQRWLTWLALYTGARLEELGQLLTADVKEEDGVSQIAYGRQRLVEIAIALALEPKVLLLDEPAAGIPSGEVDLLLHALDHLPRDIAILMIEHDMQMVRRFATEVTVLVHGKVLMTGSPHDVMTSADVHAVYLGKTGQARFGPGVADA